MDPVTAAAHRFGMEIGEFLRTRGMRSLRIVAAQEQRRDVIKTLRLVERARDNRRPVFLFDEPFESPRVYLAKLALAVTSQYEQLRANVGARGIELPELPELPEAVSDPVELVAFLLAAVVSSLAPHFDGVVLALVPPRVVDEHAFRANLRSLLALPMPPQRVHVFVMANVGDDLDACARFEIPRDRLFGFLQSLAADRPARALRATMLTAAKALADGNLDEAARAQARAAELGRARGRTRELAASLMGLGGVALARGEPGEARRVFTEAALRADGEGLTAQATQAWMGVASLATAGGEHETAKLASEAAARAIKRAHPRVREALTSLRRGSPV